MLLLLTLAMAVYFGDELTLVKTAIVMGITAITTTIVLRFFYFTIGSRSCILSAIGITTYIALAIFLIYIILSVVAAISDPSKANEWAIQYGISLGFDNLIF